MRSSSNPLRWAALALFVLSGAVTARPFSFALNNNTGLPVKWPAGAIRLKLMLGDTANLNDGSSFNTSARTAAQTWNTKLGSAQFQTELTTGSPGQDNDLNELGFAAKLFGKDFDENTLAVTTGYSFGNERTEADIIFNTKYTWNSFRSPRPASVPAGTIDIQRVALHELGHVLGLDHPDQAKPVQNVEAIMNSTIGIRYELSDDDIAGAQALYGPPGTPTNDNFANAAVLALSGSQSVSVKGYNTNATKEAGDPRQGDNPGGRSVWWRWTAPSDGGVTLDSGKEDSTTRVTNISGGQSSYYDTTLGVYTGAALANLTKIADNDDINPGVVQVSKVTFSATAGTEYRIMVDGYNAIEQIRTDTVGADNAGITLNLAFTGSLGTAPAITTQPASASVTSGGSVSFSVVATGTAPLAYQWAFNSSAIAGATNSSFSISSAASSNAGSYTVTVSNQAGSITSNVATLTVTTPPPPPAPSGGGGGGGGAPSLWFVGMLALVGLNRYLRPQNLNPATAAKLRNLSF